MKHWQIDQLPWDQFDPAKVDPELLKAVKAASVVERNSVDYAIYLNNVFSDDPDFKQAADEWAVEEIQHGDALGRWAMLADPEWDYQAAFQRYRDFYHINLEVDTSIRGSRTGELIARCMVETGTSSFYSALADATDEPALKALCRQIAADEFRHFKLFYDHMHRYLRRENISTWQRARIALGRITESEDDELASAYHTTNEPENMPYDHKRCIANYMARSMKSYKPQHLKRVTNMVFKTIGLTPHSKIQSVAFWITEKLFFSRQAKFARMAGLQRN
ncbi:MULTISPECIES: ferritin-like domain-containing protein [Acetobacter]|uniref:Ferritin-like domain-containing protein n=1 Tax=Acetobacter thailandicus TaxID=1502842 RepID=A0ABT3QC57_9PROT|nr:MULTISPECIES: ferritin-like domain-containing protein [Acetobacter]MBS0961191.1 ferritin-like domain-containing protein [Acetobacter thailandicus]MBS0981428.1 ferritin-like domain-containing protein [Acetobacter thailandicus]MBS0986608.1 ferritin-like domain-containing protein [Acetobacter thailandicus]MBS1003839.1 ferritin-like domain-containing protein [Acetobacter thailandicus]MCX2562845.1 ferritin-like domain-containing protein [Acetobacter thailandicus]